MTYNPPPAYSQAQYVAPPPQQPVYQAPQAPQPYSIPMNQGGYQTGLPPPPQIEPQAKSDSCLDCIPILRGDTERQGFVRKVYALLFIQLAITTAFVGAGVASPSFRNFMRTNQWLYLLTTGIAVIISLSLFCFYKWFKRVPLNYFLLFGFTLTESYSVAVITSFYTPMSVFAAAVLTLGMTLSLSLYACFTKSDFTSWYRGLMWAFLGTLLIFIIFIAIYPSEFVFMIITFVVIVLVSIFIIADTQVILGGQRYSLGYDDYVLGVLLLYTDIITLFLYILALFGRRE